MPDEVGVHGQRTQAVELRDALFCSLRASTIVDALRALAARTTYRGTGEVN